MARSLVLIELILVSDGGDVSGIENQYLDRRLKEQINRRNGSDRLSSTTTNHYDVLHALSRALRKTEEAYLDAADKMLDENPELALMGSCVLVMLLKGEDIYVMNVGDSRAVLDDKISYARSMQRLAMRGLSVPNLLFCREFFPSLPMCSIHAKIQFLQPKWTRNKKKFLFLLNPNSKFVFFPRAVSSSDKDGSVSSSRQQNHVLSLFSEKLYMFIFLITF
ncbi:unnamed protein product [Arabis nemorensis]|uniref:PPM-type phosphatase domain-containing protein n=1 Tax=Arabis nemorensis TaxID=586526 RepID=A0A565ARL3_9BRAS|nr:unnamed protein product [Arabis nemorensis]